MLKTIKLILPIFIPSWRFFDEIGPSPRIEFRLLTNPQEELDTWQELIIKPKSLSISSTLRRLFFNSKWNEALFIMTCAEQLVTQPSEQHQEEIWKYLRKRLVQEQISAEYLQFRLVFVSKHDQELRRDVLFVSDIKKFQEDIES